MATIISSNFYLTNTQIEDNAGLIGYQNLVTPSTISATSQISTNPITNAANPATAWGWIASDQPAPDDAISYTGTNYMPSPFDPENWRPDPDGDITNVTMPNPSGSSVVGLAEQTGAGELTLSSNFDNKVPSVLAGEKTYIAIVFKPISGWSDQRIQLAVSSDSGLIAFALFNIENNTLASGSPTDFKFTELSDGFVLLEMLNTEIDNHTNVFASMILKSGTVAAPIGSQLYVQAAYFGKAGDYPAVIAKQGIIPPQTIAINTAGQEVDYIGIAKHNLNQIGLTVTIKYNGITVVPAQSVSDKQALLFLNNLASPDTVEIIISGATSPPRIAVLYVGKALRLQRNIYVGHTPISYGRKRTAINGVSENGQYLGEIVVREMNMTSVNLQNLTPDWYRQNLDPFFGLNPRVPCFWAWRPSKYEDEVGYCWVEGDPQMSNQRSNGMVECSWNFKGIV